MQILASYPRARPFKIKLKSAFFLCWFPTIRRYICQNRRGAKHQRTLELLVACPIYILVPWQRVFGAAPARRKRVPERKRQQNDWIDWIGPVYSFFHIANCKCVPYVANWFGGRRCAIIVFMWSKMTTWPNTFARDIKDMWRAVNWTEIDGSW